MVFQFSFRHMDSSDSLKNYAEKKVREKIEKFVSKPIEAHVTFAVDKHAHMAHCAVVGGDGFNLQVEHTCGDMYGSVDMIVDKLEVQLKKQKERIKGHKGDKTAQRHFAEEAAEIQMVDEFDAPIDGKEVVQFEIARKKVQH